MRVRVRVCVRVLERVRVRVRVRVCVCVLVLVLDSAFDFGKSVFFLNGNFSILCNESLSLLVS